MTTTTHPERGTAWSLRGFLADSAYASLGLGGATVELVRSIDRIRVQTPERARAIGRQAPERLAHLVQEGVSSTLGLPRLATREFYGLARRGRDLAGAIRTNEATREATREAVDQTRTAGSRVKEAGTSIGRAAESAVQATERAATIVAARTEPAQRREIEVQPPRGEVEPPKAQVKTRRTGVEHRATARRTAPTREDLGQRTAEELQDHARKSGAEGSASTTKDELAAAPAPPVARGGEAPTGPYEERTIEELQERARQLGIEGRASMTKDELINALRERRS